jgi:hypothetical protein
MGGCMRPTTRLGYASAFVAAAIFGVLDAHLYLGRGAGFWVANVSSIWLLIPFLACAAMNLSLRGAAALGLALTTTALFAFYVWTALQGANQFTSADLRFLFGGLITGPTFGLLGRAWMGSRRFLLGMPLALAFVFEPLAWLRHVGRLPNPHIIWITESTFGAILLAAFLGFGWAARCASLRGGMA